MQLNCPNCSEKVPAANINIQELVAVCPHCDTVFKFTPKDEAKKPKHRKIKQPKELILRDEETLQLRFRTNWRLDRSESAISLVIFSAIMTFVFFITLGASRVNSDALPFSGLFGLLGLIFYYMLALTLYNSTEIEMDEERIKISRKPLPNIFNRVEEISLSGITAIRCEETPQSIKDGYDTPRYNVWAILGEDNRKLIVSDVIYDYGFFIAQRLEERLISEGQLDTARLEESEADDEFTIQEETYRAEKIERA